MPVIAEREEGRMKLGLGLYRRLLTEDNFKFAEQAGVTHIVAHLVDYFRDATISSGDQGSGWGSCEGDRLWTYEELKSLVDTLRSHKLELAAIENFSPAFWADVLLDGPKRAEQMEGMKKLIRDAGRAGVPCFGYAFNITGVWGWTRGPFARGGAMSVGFRASMIDPESPIPDGMVWNMRYRAGDGKSVMASVQPEELWGRFERFLAEIMPVAEEAGVVLAAHPDDPPMERLRRQPRLITHPERFDRMIAAAPSPSNRIELCLGTMQEMKTGDIYAAVRKYAAANRIGYIHFRNVRGKVPEYNETFVDEGDIDMGEIVAILDEAGYEGVLIPDHTPDLHCAAPWHAGMGFALGYMRALLQERERGRGRKPAPAALKRSA
jgi:mannonate dehydratase